MEVAGPLVPAAENLISQGERSDEGTVPAEPSGPTQNFKEEMMKKMWSTVALAASAVLAVSLAGCSSPGGDSASGGDATGGVDTVEAGKLIVTFGPYMPFTAEEDGKAVGMDGDIVNEVAKRLDLDVEVKVTDFAGMLSGVQTGRADVAIGTINWNEERSKSASYADDNYYNPPAVGGPEGVTYETVSDLEGKRICTVTGYAYADAIPEIEGAEAALFQRMEDVVEEFAAGRCDAAFLDPMVVSYTAKQRPDIGLKVNFLEAPTAEEIEAKPGLVALAPAITAFYATNDSVADAITEQIRAMYADGTMDDIITEYGGDPDKYLEAPAEVSERRIGVDREKGWLPPSEVRNTK